MFEGRVPPRRALALEPGISLGPDKWFRYVASATRTL